jgi:hypothetical protein
MEKSGLSDGAATQAGCSSNRRKAKQQIEKNSQAIMPGGRAVRVGGNADSKKQVHYAMLQHKD